MLAIVHNMPEIMNNTPSVNGLGLFMLEIIADIILTPSIWRNV